MKAPLERVWRAISDAQQFGAWFRIALTGEFVPGATVRGNITHPGYEHLKAEMFIEQVRPQTHFSYRWHPYAIDPQVDYTNEPTTLVEMELSKVAGGTQLVITESGFEHIPAERRGEAFRMNDQGWGAQCENVSEYVTRQ